MNEKIKVAVITGNHPYDVVNFYGIFKEMNDIDVYIQNLWDYSNDTGEGRKQYDVVVFYNMHMDDEPNEQIVKSITELSESSQGIFMLHHSTLAYPKWQLWSDIVGIEDRSFDFFIGEQVTVDVLDTDHPIINGVSSWSMIDETYTMDEADDSTPLLTIDHPNSMKTIAWAREYKDSKVFCLQSGHDNDTYQVPQFRNIIHRGILYLADKI